MKLYVSLFMSMLHICSHTLYAFGARAFPPWAGCFCTCLRISFLFMLCFMVSSSAAASCQPHSTTKSSCIAVHFFEDKRAVSRWCADGMCRFFCWRGASIFFFAFDTYSHFSTRGCTTRVGEPEKLGLGECSDMLTWENMGMCSKSSKTGNRKKTYS